MSWSKRNWPEIPTEHDSDQQHPVQVDIGAKLDSVCGTAFNKHHNSHAEALFHFVSIGRMHDDSKPDAYRCGDWCGPRCR